MSEQEQFLEVIDRDEAERRFLAAVRHSPLGSEIVPLREALGRVLSQDVVSPVDVPSFDRSNVDGFALRSEDTFGATETQPKRIKMLAGVIGAGVRSEATVNAGFAIEIGTGGMVPRGADAVLMVEHGDIVGSELMVRRAVAPGQHVAWAGTDIGLGETVLRRGSLLTSRETGTLAAIGLANVPVYRRPMVAVLSTGDELIEPGAKMRAPMVYDSNTQVICDAVRECGGIPEAYPLTPDDEPLLSARIEEAILKSDMVLLSGGTSKGRGDLCYRAVSRLQDPGIVAHGVSLKPGKPICLASSQGKAVVVLPGFPTSAIFTFHEFVAPLIRQLAGLNPQFSGEIQARLATKVISEIGRTEFLLVGIVRDRAPHDADTGLAPPWIAFPMGKGSGSVTTFSRADGFVTIGRHQELLDARSQVSVTLLGRDLEAADLVVMGSHCLGLDFLFGKLQDQGVKVKFMAIGSTGGLAAVDRGECDLAGIHLLDVASGRYNEPFLNPSLQLIQGYERKQGIVFRKDDRRFREASSSTAALEAAIANAGLAMANRNVGSGTRILFEQYAKGRRPKGYWSQAKTHNAVAAAIAQGRADWGIAIQSAATAYDLGFLELQAEQFDFVCRRENSERPEIRSFRDALEDAQTTLALSSLGLIRRESPQTFGAAMLDSFRRLLGRDLFERSGDPRRDAELLDDFPAIVVAHNSESDPLFCVANKAALRLWEMPRDEFIGMPSRLSAEPMEREERARLLAQTHAKGHVTDYQGIRVSKSGKRFLIEQAILWNVTNANGTYLGQAATFDRWRYLP